MTVIIPEGYVQATLGWASGNFDSGKASTVLGFFNDTAQTPAVEVASTIYSEYVASLAEHQLEGYFLESVTVVTGEGQLFVATGSNGGETTGTALVSSNAVLVKMASALRGRRGRGRNYWPGFLPEADVDGAGNISPGLVATLQSDFDNFFENLLLNGIATCILQHETPTGPDAPVNPTPPYDPPPPVVDIRVDAKVATQRRRIR